MAATAPAVPTKAISELLLRLLPNILVVDQAAMVDGGVEVLWFLFVRCAIASHVCKK